jgi:predicted transcriptional regulator
MGHTQTTLDWGNSLFQYYKNIAEKIDKKTIKQMEPGIKI